MIRSVYGTPFRKLRKIKRLVNTDKNGMVKSQNTNMVNMKGVNVCGKIKKWEERKYWGWLKQKIICWKGKGKGS